jgi:hypothetical protein
VAESTISVSSCFFCSSVNFIFNCFYSFVPAFPNLFGFPILRFHFGFPAANLSNHSIN